MAAQSTTTPIVNRTPGTRQADIRPAKKEAIAAIEQPNKKMGKKYSW